MSCYFPPDQLEELRGLGALQQAQEGGTWERGMGAKFVGLTDWLLGGMKNPNDPPPLPMFEDARRRQCD